MTVSSHIFEAGLKCLTKCFLQSLGETGTGNAYADLIRRKADSHRNEGVKALLAQYAQNECIVGPLEIASAKAANWRLALNCVASAQNLRSTFHALTRVQSDRPKNRSNFIPLRFVFTSSVTRDDKLLLAFDAYVLAKLLGRDVGFGKIIYGSEQSALKVKTSPLIESVRIHIAKIAALQASSSPPDLVLNRHCAECEYQSRCRQKAIEKDDLSLLSGMTDKERKRLNKKGIFTVTQLSYTFRPRRQSKRLAANHEKYHPSLKALAIREKKVHIVGRPELKVEGTPVYFDVEGLPDQDFYYLIGIRIKTPREIIQHSLWANTVDEEKRIWNDFLDILTKVDSPILIHYGRYESRFLTQLSERYGGPPEGSVVARVLATTLNVLSTTYARIYFPTYTNGLKDCADFLGFRWSFPTASGAMSVVWRHEWQQSRAAAIKSMLTTYNAEDCEALRLLTEFLCTLLAPGIVAHERDIPCAVNVESLPRHSLFQFRKVNFQLPELEAINQSAYWDYQRERILVRSSRRLKTVAQRAQAPKGIKPRPNQSVNWPAPSTCIKCGHKTIHKHRPDSKTVIDVKFGTFGIKRWITKYFFYHYRCPRCKAVFHNHERAWTQDKYGTNLRSLSVYENIELRIPQYRIAAFLNDVLHLDIPRSVINHLKSGAAVIYERTYQDIVKELCTGSLIHVDETKVNLKSGVGYVWAFANLEEVAYIYSPTREGGLLHALLKDFKGVLVSDFYAAYDSVGCPQQKCLIHLIRDMNEDLMKEPFNAEMKELVAEFAVLLRAIIATVDRFGLKARFLRTHKVSVKRFFKHLALQTFQTDTAQKCKTRLEKGRDGLFTFLDYDGVPWNNNNAEHAIKAFALLRRDFSGVATEKGIREYLVLLSICETCKCKGISFLEFLRSGAADIDEFAGRHKTRKRKPEHSKLIKSTNEKIWQ